MLGVLEGEGVSDVGLQVGQYSGSLLGYPLRLLVQNTRLHRLFSFVFVAHCLPSLFLLDAELLGQLGALRRLLEQ